MKKRRRGLVSLSGLGGLGERVRVGTRTTPHLRGLRRPTTRPIPESYRQGSEGSVSSSGVKKGSVPSFSSPL